MIPKLSVITIVYNDVQNIGRTLQSVFNQIFRDFEYIVIDGASTDGTLDILLQYQDKFSQMVSEPDKGIYDAMNKGLRLAKGEYVLFMNSGDEVFDENVFTKVFDIGEGADIIYGETQMIDDQLNNLGLRRHRAPEKFTWRSFSYGMNVCHQAIYVKRVLCEPYDSKYQLSADIDWILKAAKKAQRIVNANCLVAKYLIGGMSKKKHFRSLVERFKIMVHYYGFIPTLFNHVVIALNLATYFAKHRRTND